MSVETMSPKVALVAGGSTGIGLDTAKLLSRKGYKLAISGLGESSVEAAAKACASLSPENFQPLALACDYSATGSAASVVAQTVAHYGRLDVLIFCAGILRRTDMSADSFDNYLEMRKVNLDSAIETTLAAASELVKSNGRIVYIASIAALKTFRGFHGYCMTKASLSQFARSVAVELAPAVRVNVICPGVIKTALYDGIQMRPEDVAAAFASLSLDPNGASSNEIANDICFLVSDDAGYIRGHELVVDGGCFIKPPTLHV